MPTPTYDLISTTTLDSATFSVGFFDLPYTYRDLVLIIKGGVTSRTGQYITLNGDITASNYLTNYVVGSGSSASTTFSAGNRALSEIIENDTNNSMIINIIDYRASKHKPILIRSNNATANGVEMRAMRWASTSAIISLSVEAVGTTWLSGTSFSLYGIAG